MPTAAAGMQMPRAEQSRASRLRAAVIEIAVDFSSYGSRSSLGCCRLRGGEFWGLFSMAPSRNRVTFNLAGLTEFYLARVNDCLGRSLPFCVGSRGGDSMWLISDARETGIIRTVTLSLSKRGIISFCEFLFRSEGSCSRTWNYFFE